MNARQDPVGLCARCAHCRIVPGARSSFYFCGRSLSDERFPRYPALPVIACLGYEPPAADPDPTPAPPSSRSKAD